MIKKITLLFFVSIVILPSMQSFASEDAIPLLIPVRGSVWDQDIPFEGEAEFKFCIITEFEEYLWCHDGSLSEPETPVFITMQEGMFAVSLGDVTYDGMTEPLTNSIFNHPDQKKIRVWFKNDVNQFEQFHPDINILSVPSSINSRMLQGYTPADFLTSSSLLNSAQFPNGVISDSHLSGSISSSKLSNFVDSGKTFSIGNGSDQNMKIQADNGSGNKPNIRYNVTSDQWEVSHDGTNYIAIAVDGANCAAGQYPLGVDATGAAESCTADDDSPDSDAEVPDDLTIRGGTVDNTPVGATTRSTGAFSSVTIGASGGNAITKVLMVTSILNFPNRVAVGCSNLTVTVTGAAAGDIVSLGVPDESTAATGYQFFGWVSAADTVTVRACTTNTLGGDPDSGTFRVMVTQF